MARERFQKYDSGDDGKRTEGTKDGKKHDWSSVREMRGEGRGARKVRRDKRVVRGERVSDATYNHSF